MLGEGPDEQESKSTDPRAYPNKSVSARMAIISAGVIMNVFLAVGCFVYYFGHERHELARGPGRRRRRLAGLRGGPAARRRDRGDRRPPRPRLHRPARKKCCSARRARCFTSRSSGRAMKELIGVDIQPRREADRRSTRRSGSCRAAASRSAISSPRRDGEPAELSRARAARSASPRSTSWSRPARSAKSRRRSTDVTRVRSPARPQRRSSRSRT